MLTVGNCNCWPGQRCRGHHLEMNLSCQRKISVSLLFVEGDIENTKIEGKSQQVKCKPT